MNHRHAQPKLKVVRRKRAPAASDPTRAKLVNFAGRVFAARGYQATTVREICAAAGANVAAVNYHFGDKFGLYTEVLQQSVRAAQVEAIQNALDQNAPPEDIFRAVIRARLRGVCRGDLPDWHFQIRAHHLAQHPPAFRHLTKIEPNPEALPCT